MEFDYKGLRCPQPVLKLTVAARGVPPGTAVKVLADCPSFPKDLQKWCMKNGKVMVSCIPGPGGGFVAQVQF